MAKKLTHKEFVLRSIERLREPEYKGIHTVYTGFNEAFRDYFNEDPVAAVDRLAAEGVINKLLARGGAVILPAKQEIKKSTAKPRRKQKSRRQVVLEHIVKDS